MCPLPWAGRPAALIHEFGLEFGTHLLATFSDPEVCEEILTWEFKIVLDFCCANVEDKWLSLSQELGGNNPLGHSCGQKATLDLTNQEPEQRQVGVLGSSYLGYPFRDGEKHVSQILCCSIENGFGCFISYPCHLSAMGTLVSGSCCQLGLL